MGKIPLRFTVLLALAAVAPSHAATPPSPRPLTVTVSERLGPPVSPDFLGLSYESSMLFPDRRGQRYFDDTNAALVRTFRTLGIRNLRLGGNSVDSAAVAIPSVDDIDALFRFAKAADVRVIYSFRLRGGDPAHTAELAARISQSASGHLDCFAVGNEPDVYAEIKPERYDVFLSLWMPHYRAILKSVPDARFGGPSTARKASFTLNVARDLAGEGHLEEVSLHYYPFGSGRTAEENPALARDAMLASTNSVLYRDLYSQCAEELSRLGVPFRIDEMNSFHHGGGAGVSDSYASALWSLDWDHWWASRGIRGVNYHTGEYGHMNYVSFRRTAGGSGFEFRPISYAHLAFTAAHAAVPQKTLIQGGDGVNFTAYAYRDDSGRFSVTLINKGHGEAAHQVSARIVLPGSSPHTVWKRMDLTQSNGDIAAREGVTLGRASIDPSGNWKGQWQPVPWGPEGLIVTVPPASAAILLEEKAESSAATP